MAVMTRLGPAALPIRRAVPAVGITASFISPWESALSVTKSTVIPWEAGGLAAIVLTMQAPWEALQGIVQSGAPDWESQTFLVSAPTLPLENLGTIAGALVSPWEALVSGASGPHVLVLEMLGGMARVVVIPWEAEGTLLRGRGLGFVVHTRDTGAVVPGRRTGYEVNR